MKVQIDKTFAMPASADITWALLQDIEAVAGCMPGARITEQLDAQRYKGTVSVKLGPASMSFRGEVEVKAIDLSTRTLQLLGKGTDTTGTSAASMDLTARVEADGSGATDSCQLVGHSEVSMSGKAATFGGRMMGAVADQVLKQFADSFAARAQALQAQLTQSPAESAAAADPAAPIAPTAQAPAQLDGLALVWAIVKEWFRSLFGARKA